jgi:hypothetical protein
MTTPSVPRLTAAAAAACSLAAAAHAGPVAEPFPTALPSVGAVASSQLADAVAIASWESDSVEIRGAFGALERTITPAEMEALAPWMSLDAGPDGPTALAWSDSGRLLFIAVYDDTDPGDGEPSDAVLRYDRSIDALTLFARAELSDATGEPQHLAAAHFRARLYVGTSGGDVLAYRAGRNDTAGVLDHTSTPPGAGPVRGLAIDRVDELIFAANDTRLSRAPVASTLAFADLGAVAQAGGLAFSTHFGGPASPGLYVFQTSPSAASKVLHVPLDQARGGAPLAPTEYDAAAPGRGDLAATPLGSLLVATSNAVDEVTDDADARLPYDQWVADEFAQVVAFGKGLISPDGEPAGWVIDADVIPAWSRFHPATPDGACWVVLLLIASDHLTGDPEAQGLAREILRRYAGLAPDGIAPSRSPDGYFRHWIDPFTGNAKPGWDPELATYSTMKIALAADRAAQHWPDDPEIRDAACSIISGVTNWDDYLRASDDAVYLISSPTGGPVFGPANRRFTEGILFAEQAATYGGPSSVGAFARWIDRALSPIAVYVGGLSVSGVSPGGFLPSFITAYSLTLQAPFRADPAWIEHARNLLWSQGAWTDDFGPELFTVFSAGTTKPEWGGYNADSLSNHPGDVTTLSMLSAFAALGEDGPALGAYHAYRNGARQTFKGGASILYRRSDVDPAYAPNSAGLPDVAAGALGLAELIEPGFLDAVLALGPMPEPCVPAPQCPGDITGDGTTDVVDFAGLAANFGQTGLPPFTDGDLDGDGDIDVFDFAILVSDFGCDITAP